MGSARSPALVCWSAPGRARRAGVLQRVALHGASAQGLGARWREKRARDAPVTVRGRAPTTGCCAGWAERRRRARRI
eukprot:6796077-Prymnesium_polylepis.1